MVRSSEVPQVPLHQLLPSHSLLPASAVAVGGRRTWSRALHWYRERWQAPRQVSVPASQGEAASPGTALPFREGSPSGTRDFKGNKTPVGAGGAESCGEEGAGLPASHDCAEEWAQGLPCPWEAQIPPAGAGPGEGDVIVTFKARQRFSNLNRRCRWSVVPRERHSPSPATAASQAGVRSGVGMCPAMAPCSRGATGPHGGEWERWQEG